MFDDNGTSVFNMTSTGMKLYVFTYFILIYSADSMTLQVHVTDETLEYDMYLFNYRWTSESPDAMLCLASRFHTVNKEDDPVGGNDTARVALVNPHSACTFSMYVVTLSMSVIP